MKEVWCTWDPMPSNLPTTYVFTYKLSHRKKWKDCPDSVTKGPNSCYFEQSLGTLHNMRVVATNDLGSKVWQFNIDPDTQSKPDPPEDVKVIAETSNIAAVSWKIPSEWYSPHFTLHYKLQYYSEWEPHIWSEELDADTQLSYTLTSLDAYTCYTIHVATKSQSSSSDEYWSDWSTPSVGCTKEAAPEKGLEVNIPGQTLKGGLRNVTIRWQRLTKRQARGEITQYRMTVKDEDDPSKADIIDILDGNATEYTLQGLEVHKSYIVTVIALNTAGPSPPSFIRIVDKTQAPGPPSITEAKNLTESSIYIAWTAPSDPNGIISNYVLSYIGNSGNPQWKTITIEGSVHNYTVGDLLAYVQYEFKIQAKNELGYSDNSKAVRLYTKEGVPSAAPRNLTLQSIPSNPTSLQAMWKAPCVEDRNGIILKYKLTVCPRLSNGTCSGQDITMVTYKVSYPQSLKSSREWLSFEIGGLQPNSEYIVSASALTAAGEGPATGYVSQRTSIGAPRDIPDDVKLVPSSITDTEMTITWTHVPSYNVTSTGYEVIAVTQNNTLHCRSWKTHTTDSTITLKNLCGYETYKVVVRACSDALITDPCGDKSEPVYGRTDIGLPSKPVNVRMKESESASMLKLEWKLPDRPNGPVESLQYAIFCSVGDQNMTEMMIVRDKLEAEVDIDCGSSLTEDNVAAKCQVAAFNKNVRDRSQYGIADREQLVCYHAQVWIYVLATITAIIISLVLVLCLRKAYKFTKKHGAWSKVALPYKAWNDESWGSGDVLVNFPEERESYDILQSPRKESDEKGEIDKISCNSDKGVDLERLHDDGVNVSKKNESNRNGTDGKNIDSDQNSERHDHNDKQVLTNPSAVKEDPEDYSQMSEVNGKSVLPLPLKILTPRSHKATGEVGDYSMLTNSGGIRLPISSHPKATIDEEIPETVPVVHEDTSDSSIMLLSLPNEDFPSVGFQIPGQQAHGNIERMPQNSSQARQAELDNESPLNSYCKMAESEAGRGNNSVLINQNGPDNGRVNNSSSSINEYTTLGEYQHSSQPTRNYQRPENQAAADKVDLPGTMTSEDRQNDNSASSASRVTQDSVRPTDGYISPPTPPASVLPTATQEGNPRGPFIGPVNSDYVQVELCPAEKLNSGQVSKLGPDNSQLSNRSAAEPTAAARMQDSANVFQSNEYLPLETLPKRAVERNSSSQGVTAGESSSAHSQEYVGQDALGEIRGLPKLEADSSLPYVTDFASVAMPNNAVKREDTLQSLQKFSPSDDKNVPPASNANKSLESEESDHVEVNGGLQPSSLSDVVCFDPVSDQEIDSDEEEIESDESDRLVTTTEMDGYV